MPGRRASMGLRLGAYAAWLLVIAFVVQAYATSSPLRAPHHARMNLMLVAPEGWGFFTRDPREPRVRAYREQAGVLVLETVNHSARSQWFGASRNTSAQGMELAVLMRSVPDSAWVRTPRPVKDAAVLSPLNVVSRAPRQTLCGTVVLDRRVPVPWAWSRSRDPLDMPGESVRLEIVCDAARAGETREGA